MKPRSLRLAAAVSLALGFSLALALASIADALLFRPLPVQLSRVFTTSKDQPLGLMSYPDFEDLRTVTPSLIAQSQILVAASADGGRAPWPAANALVGLPVTQAILSPAISDPLSQPDPVAQVILSPASSPPQIRLGLAVSSNYFNLLRIPTTFVDDTQAGVVLSHAFWRSHFASDLHITGRTLRLAGTTFTILGVAPRNFGLDRFLHEDFYVSFDAYRHGLLPANGGPLEERGRRFLTVFAPNASTAQLNAVAQRLADQYPATNRGRGALVLPELDAYVQLHPGTAALARTVAAIAALILIITTANAAGLLLLAAEARAKEMTIRSALGATPLRLLCDRLRENAVIAVAAAAACIPLAWIVTRLLLQVAQPPTDIPFTPVAHFDARMLLLLVPAAFLAALVSTFCRIPRTVVAAAQIALATVLAILGVNFAATLHAARHTSLGFRTDHILTLTFDPAQLRYTESQTRQFYASLLDRSRMLPGVRSAALAQFIPMSYASAQHNLAPVSKANANTAPVTVFSNLVTLEYFDFMRIPLLEGRTFHSTDTAAAPRVAIVNQELARTAPLHSTILINGRRHIVVGIARTARYFHLDEAPRPFLYLPYAQNFASRMTLHLETYGAPADLARTVFDPDIPATDVRPLATSVWQTALMNTRTGLRAIELVGGCGLALALAGLYAVVATAALRRRREVAIRMAIGSTRVQACAALVRSAALTSVFSVSIGFVLSISNSRPAPAALLAAFAVLLLSLLAAILPAWLATRADPAAVLRES